MPNDRRTTTNRIYTRTRWRRVGVLACLLGATLLIGWPRASAQTPTYAFVNGQWFDGNAFEAATLYTVDGLFTRQRPAQIDSVIDLRGGFVVPPYGEAHNHNVESAAIIPRYLSEGIFYVKNPNSGADTKHTVHDAINRPTSLDVVFAGGGLTASGGHPLGLVRRNIERGVWTEADGIGSFVHIIDDEADIAPAWEQLRKADPDFVKTYLLYSEEFDERKGDDAYFAWKGLDPALLPKIVEYVHQHGLRVSTHVETATDFHHAVMAGVDEINHMPGFRPNEEAQETGDIQRYLIADEDAARAARQGITVVTTLGGLIRGVMQIDENGPEAALRELAEGMMRHNLQTLHKHGVPLAVGSDQYRGTSVGEAMALHALGVFDNRTLLKMWCQATPATIFPDRQIGHLQEGYEASFLVLAGNPLDGFAHTQDITLRVKQGHLLSVNMDGDS